MLVPQNLLAETQLHQWHRKASNAENTDWAQRFFRLLDHLGHWGDDPTVCTLYAIGDTPPSGYVKELSFLLTEQHFDEWGERIEQPKVIHREDPCFIMSGVLYNHGDNNNPEWGIHT